MITCCASTVGESSFATVRRCAHALAATPHHDHVVSPELRFVPDELIESGARLSALINEAVKKDAATHVDDPPSAEASSDPADDDHYDSDEDDDDADSDQDDADDSSSRPRR